MRRRGPRQRTEPPEDDGPGALDGCRTGRRVRHHADRLRSRVRDRPGRHGRHGGARPDRMPGGFRPRAAARGAGHARQGRPGPGQAGERRQQAQPAARRRSASPGLARWCLPTPIRRTSRSSRVAPMPRFAVAPWLQPARAASSAFERTYTDIGSAALSAAFRISACSFAVTITRMAISRFLITAAIVKTPAPHYCSTLSQARTARQTGKARADPAAAVRARQARAGAIDKTAAIVCE